MSLTDHSSSELNREQMVREAERILSSVNNLKHTEELMLLKQASVLAELAQSVDEAGLLLNEILVDHETAHEFGFAGTVASGIRLLAFPIGYLVAYLRGTKLPPLTLTTAAKFVYSAIGLGLGIAIFMVPGALPVLAVVGSTIAGVIAITNFIKLIKDRHANKVQIAELELKNIESDLVRKKVIPSLVEEQKALFDQAMSKNDLSEAKQHLEVLNGLHVEYSQLNSQDLFEKKTACQQQIAQLKKTTVLLNRSLGVLLACIGLVGATLLFFFPPVGMGILAATTILGGAYTLFRLGQIFLPRLWSWIKNKWGNSEVVAQEASKDALTKGMQETNDATAKLNSELQEVNTPDEESTCLSDRTMLEKLSSSTNKPSSQTDRIDYLDDEEGIVEFNSQKKSPHVIRPSSQKVQEEEGEGDSEGPHPH